MRCAIHETSSLVERVSGCLSWWVCSERFWAAAEWRMGLFFFFIIVDGLCDEGAVATCQVTRPVLRPS